MEKIKRTDTHDLDPIILDQDQRDELDRLIGSLKKEIIYPQSKKERETVTHQISDHRAA